MMYQVRMVSLKPNDMTPLSEAPELKLTARYVRVMCVCVIILVYWHNKSVCIDNEVEKNVA